jgi:hypothetical protein
MKGKVDLKKAGLLRLSFAVGRISPGFSLVRAPKLMVTSNTRVGRQCGNREIKGG